MIQLFSVLTVLKASALAVTARCALAKCSVQVTEQRYTGAFCISCECFDYAVVKGNNA